MTKTDKVLKTLTTTVLIGTSVFQPAAVFAEAEIEGEGTSLETEEEIAEEIEVVVPEIEVVEVIQESPEPVEKQEAVEESNTYIEIQPLADGTTLGTIASIFPDANLQIAVIDALRAQGLNIPNANWIVTDSQLASIKQSRNGFSYTNFTDPITGNAFTSSSVFNQNSIYATNANGDNFVAWGVTSLEGMQYLTGISQLQMTDGRITDLSPLSGLSLSAVNLQNNWIVDSSPLINAIRSYILLDSSWVSLDKNRIYDISAWGYTSSTIPNTFFVRDQVIHLPDTFVQRPALSPVIDNMSQYPVLSMGSTNNNYENTATGTVTPTGTISGTSYNAPFKVEWTSTGRGVVSFETPLTYTLFIGYTGLAGTGLGSNSQFSGIVVQEVYGMTIAEMFPDSNLAQLVATTLENEIEDELAGQFFIDRPITVDSPAVPEVLEIIESLTINSSVQDLSGLINLTGLTSIDFTGNPNVQSNGNITNAPYLNVLSTMTQLQSLNFTNTGLTNTTVIPSLPNLTSLILNNNTITDLSDVQRFSQLTSLSLEGNAIASLAPLTSLEQLTTLNINNTNTSNIDTLKNLTNLTTLYMNNNFVTDLRALGSLANLATLEATNQALTLPTGEMDQPTSFSVFMPNGNVPTTLSIGTGAGNLGGNGTNITWTAVATGNTIIWNETSIGGIANFTFSGTLTQDSVSTLASIIELFPDEGLANGVYAALLALDPSNTTLAQEGVNFTPTPAQLAAITSIQVANAGVTSLAGDGLKQLTGLTTFDLSGNTISDYSLLQQLPKLQNLNLASTNITNLTPISALSTVTTLDLSNNALSNAVQLGSMTNLTSLKLNDNHLTSVPFAHLTNLTSLEVNNNQLADLSNLSGLSLTHLSATGQVITLPEATVNVPFQTGIKDQAGAPLPSGSYTVTTGAATFDNNGQVTWTSTSGGAFGWSASTTGGTFSGTATQSALQTVAYYIKDPALAALVAGSLGITVDSGVTTEELASITSIRAPQAGITDLTGVNYLTGVTTFDLSWNTGITNWSLLTGMSNLASLNLTGTSVNLSGANSLPVLTNLHTLQLDNNGITDVSPLANFSGLETLSLSSNSIKDLSALSTLNLTTVNAESQRITLDEAIVDTAFATGIKDINGNPPATATLSPATGQYADGSVTWATANDNNTLTWNMTVPGGMFTGMATQVSKRTVAQVFTDPNLASAVANELTTLTGQSFQVNSPVTDDELGLITSLAVDNSGITNLTGMETLVNLETLDVSTNSGITDLTPLDGLNQLATLNLANNGISDTTSLPTDLPALTNLNLADNQLTTLGDVSNFTTLTALNLANNTNIQALSPLMSLTNLNVLNISNTNTDSLQFVTALTQLQTLNMSQNLVRDLSPLGSLSALTTVDATNQTIALPMTKSDTPFTIGIFNVNGSIPSFTVSGAAGTVANGSVTWTEANKTGSLSWTSTLPSGMVGSFSGTATQSIVSDLPPMGELFEDQKLALLVAKAIDPTKTEADLATFSPALSELAGVTSVDASGAGVEILRGEGLSLLTGLQNLDLSNNTLLSSTDFNNLSQLTSLETLDLSNTNIVDNFDAIQGLTKLRELHLDDNSITNVTPLSTLTNLQVLTLNNVDSLTTNDNGILDLTPLSGLTALTTLDARNQVFDFPATLVHAPFALGIKDNNGAFPSELTWTGPTGISDPFTYEPSTGEVTWSQALTNHFSWEMTGLTVAGEQVTGTFSGEGSQVTAHPVSYWFPDTNLAQAVADEFTAELGQKFTVDSGVTLSTLGQLTSLDASNSSIVNLNGLNHLDGVTTLDLSGNPNITDYSPVAEMNALASLNLTGNYMDDASFNTMLSLPFVGPLATLIVDNNLISDVSQVGSELDELTSFSINNNRVMDLSPLGSISTLTNISASGQQVALPTVIVNTPYTLNLKTPSGNVASANITPNPASGIYDESGNTITWVAPGNNSISWSVHEPSFLFSGIATQVSQYSIIQLFPDTTLTQGVADALNEELNVTTFTVNSGVSPEQLAFIETIQASGTGTLVGSETGLGYLTHLTTLDLSNSTAITDFSTLSLVPSLRTLNVANNTNALSTLPALTGLTSLNLSSNGLSDVSDISQFTGLRSLQLNNNTINDFTPLMSLTNLTSLELNNTGLANVAPLSPLTRLQTLSMNQNHVTDLQPLARLTQLTSLSAMDQTVTLTAWEVTQEYPLNLFNMNGTFPGATNITQGTGVIDPNDRTIRWDGSPVGTAADGNTFTWSETTIPSNMAAYAFTGTATQDSVDELPSIRDEFSDENLALAVLEVLKKLFPDEGGLEAVGLNYHPSTEQWATITSISAPNAGITDLSGDGWNRMTNLTDLTLDGNIITDLSPLAAARNLSSLSLVNSQITSVSGLAHVTSLTTLDLSDNEINDVTPLGSLTKLTWLGLDRNQIRDLSPLSGLTGLSYLTAIGQVIPQLDDAVIHTPFTLNIRNMYGANPPTTNVTLTPANQGTYSNGAVTWNQVGTGNTIAWDVPILTNNRFSGTMTQNVVEPTLVINEIFIDPVLAEAVANALEEKRGTATNVTDTTIPSELAALTNIQAVGTSTTGFATNLTGVSYLTGVTTFNLSGNPFGGITNIALLNQMPALSDLNLSDTQLSNAQLGSLPVLINLTTLDVSSNAFSNVGALARFTGLTHLNIDNNRVADISPLNLLPLATLSALNQTISTFPHTTVGAVNDTNIVGLVGNRPVLQLVDAGFFNTSTQQVTWYTPGTPNTFTWSEAMPITLQGLLRQTMGMSRTAQTAGTFSGTGAQNVSDVTIDTIANLFPDSGLQQAIADNLTNLTGETFTPASTVTLSQLLSITTLAANNYQITDLTGIEQLENLETANFAGNQLQNLAPLSGLKRLTTVDASNQVIQLDPVAVGENTPFSISNRDGGAISLDNPSPASQGGTFANNQLSWSAPGSFSVGWNTSIPGVSGTFSGTVNQTANFGSIDSVFTDPVLAAAVANALGKDVTDSIMPSDLETINTLNLADKGISDLTGLEHLTNLESLNLSGNNVRDISVLEQMPQLVDVNLQGNQLTSEDLSSLANLQQLTNLNIANNPLTDLSTLPDLSALISLDVSGTQVSDIAPVAKLTNLQVLEMNNNYVSNISSLGTLTNLATLSATGQQITLPTVVAGTTNSVGITNRDGSSLSNVVVTAGSGTFADGNMTWAPASIGDNAFTWNISIPGGLGAFSGTATQVTTSPFKPPADLFTDPVLRQAVEDILNDMGIDTSLGINPSDLEKITGPLVLSGVSNLDGLERLTGLTELNISDSPNLTDLSPISDLSNLTHLTVADTGVRDLQPLANLTNLVKLDLPNNQIDDLGSLSGLTQLEWLNVSNNQITSVAPLRNLPNLKEVWLEHNHVTDLRPISHVRNVHASFQTLTLPDTIVGEVFQLPAVYSLDGERIPLVVPSKAGVFDLATNTVTWHQAGSFTITWESPGFSGEMTQLVHAGDKIEEQTPPENTVQEEPISEEEQQKKDREASIPDVSGKDDRGPLPQAGDIDSPWKMLGLLLLGIGGFVIGKWRKDEQ